MASKTVSAAPLKHSIDLEGACSTLKTWLQAHEGESLDCSTAQVSLRSISEVMLAGWADAPQAAQRASGDSLMMGVTLIELAEQSLSAPLSGSGDAVVPQHTKDVVFRALGLLEAVSAARTAA
jgi:hypothetical protein